MNKQSIGIYAEKALEILQNIRMTTIPELAQKLNLSIENTTLAIGWLACEDKINIESENGMIGICDKNHLNYYIG